MGLFFIFLCIGTSTTFIGGVVAVQSMLEQLNFYILL